MAQKFVKSLLESVQNPERQKASLSILQEAQNGEIRIDTRDGGKTGIAYVLKEAGLLDYKGIFFKDDTYAMCSIFVITDKGKEVTNDWMKEK